VTSPDDREEREIQASVKDVLELEGYQVDDMSQPRRSMMPLGLPDLRARHPKLGVRFWTEVKRPGEEPSEDQDRWHAVEIAAGGIVYVVDSAELMLMQCQRIKEQRIARVELARAQRAFQECL